MRQAGNAVTKAPDGPAPAGALFEKERVALRNAMNAVAVHERPAGHRQLMIDKSRDAAMGVGRPLVHQAASERQRRGVAERLV
ncbi:MAG: hypothetical protein AAF318_07345 [Pseudomonadota bacterium]